MQINNKNVKYTEFCTETNMNNITLHDISFLTYECFYSFVRDVVVDNSFLKSHKKTFEYGVGDVFQWATSIYWETVLNMTNNLVLSNKQIEEITNNLYHNKKVVLNIFKEDISQLKERVIKDLNTVLEQSIEEIIENISI